MVRVVAGESRRENRNSRRVVSALSRELSAAVVLFLNTPSSRFQWTVGPLSPTPVGRPRAARSCELTVDWGIGDGRILQLANQSSRRGQGSEGYELNH